MPNDRNTCYTPSMLGWLLVYKVPSEPSTARVTVWRRMRALGAIYLQQSVCFLGDSAAHREALHAVADEIRAHGGDAWLLRVADEEAPAGASLLDLVRAARAAEYAELHEQVDQLAAEVARERAAGKFTFAELEDIESGLERLRTWLERIRARDLPDSEAYRVAATALAVLTAEVGDFVATVYRHEAQGGVERGA
ncbi:MAG TPA: Chromate resistance protein ChrB [Thermomicrobiales bacterium]|nr:Chromate resistance protein ChrB [Thermomicrobiales bacterium]